MGTVVKGDFKRALRLAKSSKYSSHYKTYYGMSKSLISTTVLKYEPTNETVEEYLPVLNELIKIDQEGKLISTSLTLIGSSGLHFGFC